MTTICGRSTAAGIVTGPTDTDRAEGAAAAYRSYLGFHLASSDACIRVAEAQERGGPRVAGFCLLLINRNLPMFLPARYGYLSDLAVDPAWRRQGIGKALLGEVKRWLAEKEISTIQLQVYSKNAPGAEFWRAAGFGAFYDRLWLGL